MGAALTAQPFSSAPLIIIVMVKMMIEIIIAMMIIVMITFMIMMDSDNEDHDHYHIINPASPSLLWLFVDHHCEDHH